ncbi:MAG: hypothetical protein ACRCXT_18575 [Paraclostridium sp.]
MKPVFLKELNYLGIDSKLDGYLWVDKRSYRAFDKDGVEIKYGRSLDKLPKETNNLLTHKEYCDIHYNNHTKAIVERESKFR